MRFPLLMVTAALVLTGCVRSAPRQTLEIDQPVTLELRLADTSPAPGRDEVAILPDGERVYMETVPLVTGADFARVEATPRPDGLMMNIIFTPEAGRRLGERTEQAVGRQLVLLADGRVLMAAVLVSSVGGASVPLHAMVPMTEDEALSLARRLSPESAPNVVR